VKAACTAISSFSEANLAAADEYLHAAVALSITITENPIGFDDVALSGGEARAP
jgi:hypothetical protein